MSWQAMEAVQDHSEWEDHTALSILYAIARHADGEGVVGAAGRHSSPNQKTLAEKARVSKRTLNNWIPKLEESGELVVERHGKGRGKWNRYTITLPMPADNGESQVTPKEEDNGVNELKVMVQNLAETVQELKVMVKETVHNGEARVAHDTEEDTDLNYYTPPTNKKILHLAHHFEQLTGFPLPDLESKNWKVDWQGPIQSILNRAEGDVGRAAEMIGDAVRVHRGENEQGKTYFIKNPGSIQTAALNLPVGSNGAGHYSGIADDEAGGFNV